MTDYKSRDDISGALLNKNSSALEEYKFKKNILRHINMLVSNQEKLEQKILVLEDEIVKLKKESGN